MFVVHRRFGSPASCRGRSRRIVTLERLKAPRSREVAPAHTCGAASAQAPQLEARARETGGCRTSGKSTHHTPVRRPPSARNPLARSRIRRSGCPLNRPGKSGDSCPRGVWSHARTPRAVPGELRERVMRSVAGKLGHAGRWLWPVADPSGVLAGLRVEPVRRGHIGEGLSRRHVLRVEGDQAGPRHNCGGQYVDDPLDGMIHDPWIGKVGDRCSSESRSELPTLSRRGPRPPPPTANPTRRSGQGTPTA